MKQYNRVTGSEKVTDHNGTHWHAQNYINAIVTTIEELREVWAMAKSGPDYPGVFELFLKSKGIELTK